jgi:Bacterial PH domain
MPSFTVFRPGNSLGTVWGAAGVGVTLLLGAGLLYRGLTLDVGMRQFAPLFAGGFFVCLCALFAYWTWSCASLRYVVDRNALDIRWGGIHQIIPLANIERLVPGEDTDNPQIEGVNWVGHHIGRAEVDQIGDVIFYSAHRSPGEVLYVQTPTEIYGISVPDPVFFAQTVQSNQSRGPLFEQRQAVHRWGPAAQSFWFDRSAQVLAILMVVAFGLVLGYVLDTYPGLSQSVPLRFPSLGGVVRVTDKGELLDIPRSAFGFLALDLVLAVLLHSWERMVGYVLLLAGIGVQVMLLIAAILAVA